MGSYTRLLVHLIWSTKLRAPMIDGTLKARLHSYLSARCQEFGCLALAVGASPIMCTSSCGCIPTWRWRASRGS